MFEILPETKGDILAVEIIDSYTKEDLDALVGAFEGRLAEGHDRINLLIKIDRMKLLKSDLGALVSDAMFALKNMDKMRHIAVVGDSLVEKILIEMDNKLFGSKKKDLVEKYFSVKDVDKALAFLAS